MRQLSSDVIAQITKLRYKGASYKEIARKLFVGVGTSHKYTKNVKVSPAGVQRLERKLKKKQNLFKRRYATPKEIPMAHRLTLSKIRIISHCLFDGSVVFHDGNYRIKYTNASWGLIKQFMRDMYNVYGLEPVYVRLNDGKNQPWWEVEFFSKRAVEDLLRYSLSYSTLNDLSLPRGITRNRKFIRAFLRAFWEDEGCIDYAGRLIAKSKSRRLIHDIQMLHQKFGISCSIWFDSRSNVYGIYVRKNSENFHRFSEKIGFGSSVITRGRFSGRRKGVILESVLSNFFSPKT
jgi:hypothetical protein